MTPSGSTVRPYRRSGLDTLVDRIAALPLWPPLAYALLALLLVGAVHLVAMADGSLPWGRVSFPLVGFAVWCAYVLAAKAHIRSAARGTVEALRPALRAGEDPEAVDAIRYRLTTQPAVPTFLAGAGFLLLAAPSTFLDPHYLSTTGLFTSPAATTLHALLLVAALWLTGAAGYGIVHTLRVIDDLYVHHVRIDVLAPQDLFALSRLAARAALVVLLMQYVFVASNPAVVASRAVVTQLVAWQALAVALFVWPLWNAHRLLAAARAELSRAAGRRTADAARALHAAVDAGDLERAAEMKEVLAALASVREAARAASTWPWDVETPRVLLSALLLPTVAWLLQQGLERWLR